MAISGIGLLYATAGGIFLWSGIKGEPIAQTIKEIASGKQPSGTDAQQITLASAPSVASTASGGGGGGGGGGSVSAPANQSAAKNQALAKMLAISMGHPGWTTGTQWSDWVKLWNQESGWSATAKNPSSGAFGIPQALPASKMASAGSDWQTNPATQIKWGIGYIADRYGSPSAAWAHEQANNWY